MASLVDNPKSNKHTRILRLPEVMDRTGDSRSTIYRLDKKGILRRAKHLDGSTSAGWHEDSVDAYNESRRPDPIASPGASKSCREKPAKSSALNRYDREDEVTTGFRHATEDPDGSTGGKRDGGVSSELQATTMMILGNKVYFHAPTGKLFLEVGKAPAFLRGINPPVNEDPWADADRSTASLKPVNPRGDRPAVMGTRQTRRSGNRRTLVLAE